MMHNGKSTAHNGHALNHKLISTANNSNNKNNDIFTLIESWGLSVDKIIPANEIRTAERALRSRALDVAVANAAQTLLYTESSVMSTASQQEVRMRLRLRATAVLVQALDERGQHDASERVIRSLYTTRQCAVLVYLDAATLTKHGKDVEAAKLVVDAAPIWSSDVKWRREILRLYVTRIVPLDENAVHTMATKAKCLVSAWQSLAECERASILEERDVLLEGADVRRRVVREQQQQQQQTKKKNNNGLEATTMNGTTSNSNSNSVLTTSTTPATTLVGRVLESLSLSLQSRSGREVGAVSLFVVLVAVCLLILAVRRQLTGGGGGIVSKIFAVFRGTTKQSIL
eukprot:PhM_4_TR12922/c0_g1_i1/m.2524